MTDFFDSVLDKCVNETGGLNQPTRENLVFILKGLGGMGIETKDQLPKHIFKIINQSISDSSEITKVQKKVLVDILHLFLNNYTNLYQESINLKKNILLNEIKAYDNSIMLINEKWKGIGDKVKKNTQEEINKDIVNHGPNYNEETQWQYPSPQEQEAEYNRVKNRGVLYT